MAQAQVTIKVSPMELTVIQEALQSYLVSLAKTGSDDNGIKFRQGQTRMILTEIGVGLPQVHNGARQMFNLDDFTQLYDGNGHNGHGHAKEPFEEAV